MFEQSKLKKYSKYIVGFAYDYFLCDLGSFGMQTYLVLYKDNNYSFIKFRTFRAATIKEFNCLINHDYHHLSYWAAFNNKDDIQIKNLAK